MCPVIDFSLKRAFRRQLAPPKRRLALKHGDFHVLERLFRSRRNVRRKALRALLAKVTFKLDYGGYSG